MDAFQFLDLDRVMRTHRSLIEAYGGTGGVSDVVSSASKSGYATGMDEKCGTVADLRRTRRAQVSNWQPWR